MIDYFQPEFYHFCEDSLHLVDYVFKNKKTASHILDLGAGCGVIGIEIANKIRPETLSLIEVQNEFLSSLEQNIYKYLYPAVKANIIQKSFSDWQPSSTYDLIVCNPPYFLSGHGIQSPDRRKQTCRSFIIDGWDILLNLTLSCLSNDGRAFFVIKKDDRLLKIIHENMPYDFKIEEKKGLLFLTLSRLDVN